MSGRRHAALVLFIASTACGGEDAASAPAPTVGVDAASPDVVVDRVVVSPPVGTTLTTVEIVDESGSASERRDVPVTFAQVFAQGDVPSGARVAARFPGGAAVSLQSDVKATHADGSVRHAVLTVLLPTLAAGGRQKVELVATRDAAPAEPAVTSASLLATAFDAVVSLTVGGTPFTASAKDLLVANASKRWLEGPLVSEWLLAAPVKSGTTAHPHLTARFAVRAYAGAARARVDVIVDNDWAYAPAPQTYTADVDVNVSGKAVYTRAGVSHRTQARWRKTFFIGEDPGVGVKLETSYLLASGAVPHYDSGLAIAEPGLAKLAASATVEPMEIGLATEYMPQTGGRPDIGPLPSWSATYLLSMDARARRAMLATADGAGSWPIHYRDQKTDQPITIADYPYMTLLGNPGDTVNPATGKSEAFPDCGGDCSSPLTPDSSHQPSLVYLPYVVTGDHYYLEELEFWANWNMLQANPGYRDQEKGLLKWDQVRGQAWSLRTLAQAAYIVPDADPEKAVFADKLANNLRYYGDRYQQAANDSVLGILTDGYAFAYENGRGVAPWQDDFFTWAVGHAVDLGFADAQRVLAYKARFPIGRMTATGYCWIDGAPYFMLVRDSDTSPVYTSFAQAYTATIGDPVDGAGVRYLDQACASQAMADWRTRVEASHTWKAGEMTGYADSPEGYPSNMQPALAAAADSGIAGGAQAWQVFIDRSVKPDYSEEPQFAVVPR
jgi:hypothetical protein